MKVPFSCQNSTDFLIGCDFNLGDIGRRRRLQAYSEISKGFVITTAGEFGS